MIEGTQMIISQDAPLNSDSHGVSHSLLQEDDNMVVEEQNEGIEMKRTKLTFMTF